MPKTINTAISHLLVLLQPIFHSSNIFVSVFFQILKILRFLDRIHINRLIHLLLWYEYNSVLRSKQRILNFITVTGVDAMATTAPQAGTSTPVSTAAKRPTKTQAFLKSLCAPLSIFDDEIATLTDVRETAYAAFVTAYKTAFTKIWPKIDAADITIILTSVKDTELRQLRRLSEMLCPDKEQPKLVEEKRTVPTLDNILSNLVNQIPEQKLPDKETCSLISDVFSNLAEAHRYSATAAKGLADCSKPGFTRTIHGSSGGCCTTNPTTCLATRPGFASCCTTSGPQNINYAVRSERAHPVL